MAIVICHNCGYDMDDLARCPKCGAENPHPIVTYQSETRCSICRYLFSDREISRLLMEAARLATRTGLPAKVHCPRCKGEVAEALPGAVL